MVSNLVDIFVYGTLKPGECNYQRYCVDRVVKVRPAIAFAQLFALPVGYPAMVAGDGLVYGVILSFADASIFEDLDILEDYHPHRPPEQNEYQRQKIPIYDLDQQPIGLVWTYLMDADHVRSLGGIRILSGCWKNTPEAV